MNSTSETPETISRREAIQRIGTALGGTALVGGNALLTACVSYDGSRRGHLFSEQDIAFLDEVADTILPETDTPGAKAAGVGAFISVMVTDTYNGDEQKIFTEGMQSLDDECRVSTGTPFMTATPGQRLELLEQLDKEQFNYMNSRSAGAPVHYFRMLKQLTLLGYFTSEIGYKQAMRYIEAPGRFEPCVPYSPGDKAWAPHA